MHVSTCTCVGVGGRANAAHFGTCLSRRDVALAALLSRPEAARYLPPHLVNDAELFSETIRVRGVWGGVWVPVGTLFGDFGTNADRRNYM